MENPFPRVHHNTHQPTRVERVLHPLLASRVVLDIRTQAGTGAGDNSDGQTELTEIVFHPRTGTGCNS